MIAKLSPQDEDRAQRLIDAGRFDNLQEILHAGLDALEEDDEWRQYAHDRIQRGLNDIAEGRTISGEEFLAQLHKARLKQA